MTITNILGTFFLIITTVLLFADMYFSTNVNYGFELKWWYIALGYFKAIALFILPEELLIKKITIVFEKLVGKVK